MSYTFQTTITAPAEHLPPEYVALVNAEDPDEEPLTGDDEVSDIEVEVEYEGGTYVPARLHGHPDSWHPDESEAAEIVTVTIIDGDHDITGWFDLDSLVSEAEEDQAGSDPY